MSASDDRGSLIFTRNGPTSPDASEIRLKLGNNFKTIWGQNIYLASETPQGQFLDSETVIVFDKNNKLVYLSNMWDPETSDGRWQDGICKIYFISRKPAIPTQVAVVCTGLRMTIIRAGSLVQDSSGYQYAAMEDIIIPAAGSITGMFACTTAGPIACPAGSITKIVTGINGWDLAENELAGAVGSYEERRAALEWRRYDSVAKNAHGNVSAIWGALANLDNVLSVQIAENVSNVAVMERGVRVDGHSVFISIVGGAEQEIAWTIYQRKDGGCGMDGNTNTIILIPTMNNITTQPKKMTYNRPTQVNCAVKVNIATTADTPSELQAMIKQAIIDNWNGQYESMPRVEIGETVLASRFYCIINHIDLRFFDLLRIRVARQATGSGETPNWQDAVGFTLDEYPVVTEADIVIVEGTDPDDSGGDGQFFYRDPDTGRIVLKPYVSMPTAKDTIFTLDDQTSMVEPIPPKEEVQE